MADENGTVDAGTPAVTTQFAIVQRGYITPESAIVEFKDEEGIAYPQILSVWGDKETAERRKSRLIGRIAKVKDFGKFQVSKSTPILGIMPVTFAAGTGRKPMTEEQRRAAGERLQKARKRAKGK